MKALFALLLVGDPAEGHGESVHPVDGVPRIAARHRRYPPRADHLDESVFQARSAHAFGEDGGKPVSVHLHLEVQAVHVPEEPVEMGIEPEEAALPDVHDVVGGVPVEETPVEDRQAGFRQRQVVDRVVRAPRRIVERVERWGR